MKPSVITGAGSKMPGSSGRFCDNQLHTARVRYIATFRWKRKFPEITLPHQRTMLDNTRNTSAPPDTKSTALLLKPKSWRCFGAMPPGTLLLRPRSQIETTCHLSNASCSCTATNLQWSMVYPSNSMVHSIHFGSSCSINKAVSIWI